MGKYDIDKHFPRNGPCMFHPTRYARHRLIDAIRARHNAGESIAHLAKDYNRPRSAIRVAVESTSDDNRMTRKEVREGKAMWRKFNRIMGDKKMTEREKDAAIDAL